MNTSWLDDKTFIKGIIIALSACLVLAIAIYYKTAVRLEVADKYIQELESAIGADGTVVGDVCGGDGYFEYYNPR